MTTIDTETLKARRPIGQVVEGYGIGLKAAGRTLIGRCPFHHDGGRPNLTVYEDTNSWYCFRCGIGGDAISFIRLIEGIGFREAVLRLGGDSKLAREVKLRNTGFRDEPRRRVGPRDQVERECLAAAVELYRNALLSEPQALAYATARGVSSSTLDRLHVGYCAGAGLVEYLRWLGLPTLSAVGAGLLWQNRDRGLTERMAGRVVVPELRAGRPVWLVGRAWDPPDAEPKYLCLAGSKPLLGWEHTRHGSEVYVTEGVFDWLVLVEWGLPAVALVGTHACRKVGEALRRFPKVYIVLDTDEAGRTAAAKLAGELAGRAVVVGLPGVKDVAELGLHPDGRDVFLEAVRAAGTTGYERGGANVRR